MSTRFLPLLRTTLPLQYVLVPLTGLPSKKNVPTMGSPSKWTAVGVPAGAAAMPLAAGEEEPGAGFAPGAVPTGLAWAIRSAVQYSVSADSAEAGVVGADGETEDCAGRGGDGAGAGGAGVVPDAGGVVADRDAGGGEAGEEAAGTEAAGDGLPAAVAVGPVSKTALTARASGVNHLVKGLLPERDDDAATRVVMARQFDEEAGYAAT